MSLTAALPQDYPETAILAALSQDTSMSVGLFSQLFSTQCSLTAGVKKVSVSLVIWSGPSCRLTEPGPGAGAGAGAGVGRRSSSVLADKSLSFPGWPRTSERSGGGN